jgi:hypothetical protein
VWGINVYTNRFYKKMSTYYVATTGNDGNPGTEGSPFLTIQHGIDSTVAGDTVVVKDGIYTTANEYMNTIYDGGTSNNIITIRAENNKGSILDGEGVSSSCFNFASGVSYVTISGFEIKNFLWEAFNINNVNPNTNIIISDNHIHNIGGWCTDTPYGIDGSYIHYADNIIFERNIFNNIGRLAPGESGCSPTLPYYQNHDHGLYIDGCDNITIRYNIFYNMQRGWGVHVYSGTDLPSSNLNIYNNTFAFGNPYRDGAHIILWGDISNVNIKNNLFYGEGNFAISTNFTSYTWSNIVVDNNLAFATDNNHIDIFNQTTPNTTLINNVLNDDPLLNNPVSYDFTLSSSSPAINTGVDVGLTTDYLGNPIVGVPDIGAYEYQETTTTTTTNNETTTTTTNNETTTTTTTNNETTTTTTTIPITTTTTTLGYTTTTTTTVPSTTTTTTNNLPITTTTTTSPVITTTTTTTILTTTTTTITPTTTTTTTKLIYWNGQATGTAKKNNCPSGYSTALITYIVNAGTYSSTISQVAADKKATDDVAHNKQAYANINGICIPLIFYYNVRLQVDATKNNCPKGYTGTTVTYIVPAKKYSSTLSQAEADAKALADLNANKQTYANNCGRCRKNHWWCW